MAPALRQAEPFRREAERRALSEHQPREARGHLRTQRHAVAGLRHEVVHLLGDLLPPFAEVELLGLQHRRVVLLEAEPRADLTEHSEQVVPGAHLLRGEVATALDGVGGDAGGGGLLFALFG